MSDPSFDDLLNGVLQQDAKVEPLEGLEERVMKRVMVPRRSPRSWKPYLWALTIASPVCLTIAILANHSSARSVTPVVQAKVPVAVTQQALQLQDGNEKQSLAQLAFPVRKEARNTAKRADLKNTIQKREALPKLDVFPTPAQVSEPVREFAELSFRPGVQVSGLAASAPQGGPPALTVEPITIAAIETKPLFPIPGREKNKVQDHQEIK